MAYKDPKDPRALESRRQHYRNNKQAYIDRAKATRRALVAYLRSQKDMKPCMDCGVPYPYYVMQFDHRPGVDKLCDPCKLPTMGSLVKLKAELAKCDLVCANCHAVRTWQRRQEVIESDENDGE